MTQNTNIPNNPESISDVSSTDSTVASSEWSCIYVNGNGETIIAGKGLNAKASNESLNTLSTLFDHLASKQQAGTNIGISDLQTVVVLKNLIVEFVPQSTGNKRQRFMWKDIEPQFIEDLALELINNRSM